MAKCCLIMEECNVVRNDEMYILHEEKVNYQDTPVNKIIFRTRLHSAEEVNGNNRYYPKSTCLEIVNSLASKAKGRSLFQEVDHPISFGADDSAFKKRAAIVEIKNCGSLVRNIYLEGKDIIAEVETLSGFKGPDLANLIKEDKANLGFSWRGFASLKPRNTTGNIMEVTTPLRAINL